MIFFSFIKIFILQLEEFTILFCYIFNYILNASYVKHFKEIQMVLTGIHFPIFRHKKKIINWPTLLFFTRGNKNTINFLNIRTPKKFIVITLKFELCVMSPNDADRMANSADPDQTRSSLIRCNSLSCPPGQLAPRGDKLSQVILLSTLVIFTPGGQAVQAGLSCPPPIQGQ